MILRHLFAILVLPVVVTVIVPGWIARTYAIVFRRPDGALDGTLLILGGLALMIGLVMFSASLYYFARYGRGTLAPWDPPRHLVVRGPYRYVRNPMISGVIFLLFGEALALRSLPHSVWALIFLVGNLVFIPLLEEPGLEARFGDEYNRYRRHVPRFVPRLRPWNSDTDDRP